MTFSTRSRVTLGITLRLNTTLRYSLLESLEVLRNTDALTQLQHINCLRLLTLAMSSCVSLPAIHTFSTTTVSTLSLPPLSLAVMCARNRGDLFHHRYGAFACLSPAYHFREFVDALFMPPLGVPWLAGGYGAVCLESGLALGAFWWQTHFRMASYMG